MKKGDTIYCKKNFYIPTFDHRLHITDNHVRFEEYTEYKIVDIKMEYWKPLGDCTVFLLKDNEDVYNTIPERYITHYFLTRQEYRKLKLEKLNGNI